MPKLHGGGDKENSGLLRGDNRGQIWIGISQKEELVPLATRPQTVIRATPVAGLKAGDIFAFPIRPNSRLDLNYLRSIVIS